MNIKKFIFQPFSGMLFLFVVAHFCHHLLPSLLVPLLPFIRNDLQLDYTQSGLLISAFSLSYGIGQLPAGWFTDAIGPRKMIAFAISGVALAGLLTGFSTSYIMMIVCLVMMGLSGGGYHPSVPPLIFASMGPQSRGLALGLHVIGGVACFFLTPLIAAVIAYSLGWRSAYIGLGLPTIGFGIILYLFLKSQPLPEIKKNQGDEGIDDKISDGVDLRQIVVFLILSILTSAIASSCLAFIPLFMVDRFAIGEKTAAAFLSIIFSAGFWGAPLGGYLSDRFGTVPTILAVCFISGPVIYSMNLVPYGWGFGGVLLVFGMVLIMRMPISESYLISHIPPQRRSTILGIYFFGCTESGGLLTPVLGSFIDRFGFYNCYTAAGILLFCITLICSFFLRKNHRQT